MKINSNSGYKVSFGYDKKLNSELKSKLEPKKDKDPYCKAIWSLNETCNTTEDAIEEMENKVKPIEDILDLGAALTVLKLQLITMVDNTFPKLRFGEREAVGYRKTAEANDEDSDDSWRLEIAQGVDADVLTEEQERNIANVFNAKIVDKDGNPSEAESLADISYTLNGILNQMMVKPASLQTPEVISCYVPNDESPKGFKSIAGMDKVKETLYHSIIEPLRDAKQAELDKQEYGKKLPRGVLFYGPPGCGKTFVTRALAAELKLPLFELKIEKAGSKYINETSSNYEKAFAVAQETAKASKKPVLMFIDEIDGLTKNSDERSGEEDLKQRSTLLRLIENGRANGLIIISATNKYKLMDEGIKRRFDGQIYVGLPDEQARKALVTKALEGRTKAQTLLKDSAAIGKIAQRFIGFSNDDICLITDKAAMAALSDGRREIKAEDFYKVIPENASRKVRESDYQANGARPPIGFVRNS